MKKFISAALALAMVLSFGSASFAEVYVNNESKGAGEVTHNGDAQVAYANAAGDNLTVTGDVTGDSQKSQNSVSADHGAEITVFGTVSGEIIWPGDTVYASGDSTTVRVGNVEDNGKGNAIFADEAQVTVNGDVTESDDGSAVYAINAQIAIDGDVTESDGGHAIYASNNAQVVINGNIDEAGEGFAISVIGDGTTVTVNGDVTEDGTGSAISAAKNATVIVGGDVTDGIVTDGSSDAIASGLGAMVIVEGLVTGDLSTNGTTNSGTIYIGELKGTIKENSDSGKIHYLIGTAAESSAELSAVTLVSDIVAAGTIDGVNKTGYRYTSTGDAALLNGATITLKPSSGNKLTVAGLPEGVVLKNKGGAAVLTLPENFKGGLQNLLLTLAKSGRKVVNVYVRIGGLTLPEGIGAEDVKASDKVNCAGFTAAASLAGGNSVQVFRDGSELSAKDYRVSTNADGSVSVVLNNDYLFALGNGTYDFTAKVGEVEIGFSVVVTK